jgi:hypothetical protein
MFKKNSIIHPFLLAIFPILFLFNYNLAQVKLLDIVMPTLISLATATLIFNILRVKLNKNKAGLITSFFIILIFGYGHFTNLIYSEIGYSIGKFLIPTVALIFIIIGSIFLFKFLKNVNKKKKIITLFLLILSVLIVTPTLLMFHREILSLILENEFLISILKLFLSNSIFSSIWIATIIPFSYFVIKSKRKFTNLTKFLNSMSIILIILLLIQIGLSYNAQKDNSFGETNTNLSGDVITTENLIEIYPDIYYIILDEYGRSDKLEELYNYSNDGFLDILTDKGFYIASESRSNYASTELSLASSLNMGYINFIAEEVNDNSNYREKEYEGRKLIDQMIKNNEVSSFLQNIDYTTIFVSSGEGMTSYNENADINYVYGYFNSFNRILIETSWLRTIVLPFVNEEEGKRIIYNLEMISKVPEIEEPTFVFAHIMAPHPPYVFDREGNSIPPERYDVGRDTWQGKQGATEEGKEAYIEQLIFINSQIEKLVDEIINKSEEPPIIIIQADHGTQSSEDRDRPNEELLKERFAILNVYYLPNEGNEKLYNSISPVNSFRIIFNHYFYTNYELLEDQSYYSTLDNYFNYTLIPNEDSTVWDKLKERR